MGILRPTRDQSSELQARIIVFLESLSGTYDGTALLHALAMVMAHYASQLALRTEIERSAK